MSNDTISNNPEMLEAARRAAAEVNLPKLPYDPKALAREVWDEYADAKVDYPEGFEGFWNRFETNPSYVSPTDPCFPLKESEFRQFVAGMVLFETGAVVAKKAERLVAQATALREAVFIELDRRTEQLGMPKRNGFMDIRNGLYRSSQVCPDHPEGCDKAASAGPFHKLPGGMVGGVVSLSDPKAVDALKNLLDSLSQSKNRKS